MKIFYVGAFRFPAGDASAARVLNNGKILSALGHEVIFISWGGKPRECDYRDGKYYYQGFEYVNTEEISKVVTGTFDKIRHYLKRGKKTLDIIKNSADVDAVITYDTHWRFYEECIKLCKKRKIMLISDLSEWFAAYEFGGKMSPLFWLNELNMRYTQKRIKNKIVISSFLDHYYSSCHNIILPPLVDLSEEKWDVSPSSITDERITHSKKIKILFSGSRPKRKNQIYNFLRAFMTVMDEHPGKLQLMILGMKNNYVSDPELKNRVLQYDDIMFLGRVSQETVPAYYYWADFSIITRYISRKNMAGFPTKMAESIASCRPVIFNPTSNIVDYVEDNVSSIVIKDNSPESIAEGLRRIINMSPEDIAAMKERCGVISREVFDYHAYIDKMDQFLKEYQW